MITEEQIERFYNDVRGLKIKFKNKIIAEKTGYSKSNVSEFINGKKPAPEEFVNLFYEKFKSYINVPRAPNNEMPKTTQVQLEGYSEQIILNLSESIRIQAEASKQQAEANREQAEGNNRGTKNTEKVIEMLKEQISSGAQAQNNTTEPPISRELLEALAELGSGKQWGSKEEALRELGMILNLHKPGKRSKASTLSDGGK